MLILKIAFRYLRGLGSANAVPILSKISMGAIAVSSAAMIIVFSVFNGLESVVKNIYNDFYPDVRVSIVRGKFFVMDSVALARISAIPGVTAITKVIEDNVFANSSSQQKVITLKGIENDYFAVNNVRHYITQGDTSVSLGPPFSAIMGMQVMNDLGADVNSLLYVTVYYPNPEVTNPTLDPLDAFQSLKLHPAGVFHVQDDFDSKYVLAPLMLVQQLFHRSGYYSSIEIKTAPGQIPVVQSALKQMLGKSYLVESRYEQNKALYMVMGSEKWAVYIIMVLVLLIAAFNMVGALTTLVMQKQKDIAILLAMGASPGTIRKIFLIEGQLWALIGALIGLALGYSICLAQLHFGLLKMGSSFVVDAFPVKLVLSDFLLVMVTIVSVGLIASWYPSYRAIKVVDPTLKST